MRIELIVSSLLAVANVAGTAVAEDTSKDTLGIEGLGEFFFPFDSARSTNPSDEVAVIAEYARNNPNERIVLDAYTDLIGDPAYNIGLAIRRGKSIESKLVAAGVDADRIIVVAYGEAGMRRSANSYDRRVTVWATNDPLYAIVDHSLVEGTAVVWEKPVAAAELEAPGTPEVATR
jgi:outer membrane protein OmpA-like peptidoglycan-associated protein